MGILFSTTMMQQIMATWYSPIATVEETEAQLKEGKEPDERDSFGLTPLMNVATQGYVDMAELYIKYGADVNAQASFDYLVIENQGFTPLHFGTLNSYPDIVALLLANDADPLIVDGFAQTPLHVSLMLNDFDAQEKIFRQLMYAGGNPNMQNASGATILHLLVEQHAVQLLTNLVAEYGFLLNVNLKNNIGLTPLELAKSLNWDEIPEVLSLIKVPTLGLIFTKDVNERDKLGYAGVHYAAFMNDPQYLKQLIARRADLSARAPGSEDTPLFMAAHFGFATIVRILLDHKAPTDVANKQGRTIPMVLLGIRSLDQRMQFLLTAVRRGANLNAVDFLGNTMMHYAVLKHDTAWIRRLLKVFGNKIDWSIKNNKGLTPLDIATKKKYIDIIELLKPLGSQ